jgi:hypothetical protein
MIRSVKEKTMSFISCVLVGTMRVKSVCNCVGDSGAQKCVLSRLSLVKFEINSLAFSFNFNFILSYFM